MANPNMLYNPSFQTSAPPASTPAPMFLCIEYRTLDDRTTSSTVISPRDFHSVYDDTLLPQQNVPEGFPTVLTSRESSSSEYAPETKIKKPSGSAADTGTYTCTYHGCTSRFDTPAKLLGHRLKVHRKINSGNGSGMTSGAQDGKRRPYCEKINPWTRKPCNQAFSRPYDLTRHDNTVHSNKEKIKCPLCFNEKHFNRKDALGRHLHLLHKS